MNHLEGVVALLPVEAGAEDFVILERNLPALTETSRV
jgi:hypothetical protein